MPSVSPFVALLVASALAINPTLRAQSTSETGKAPKPVTPEKWLERLTAGKLSPEEITSVTAQALRAQADNQLPWNSAWGDFIQAVHENDHLSEDQWRDYLLKSIQVKIRVASSASRISGLRLWVDHLTARMGRAIPYLRAVGHRYEDLSGIAMRPSEKPRKETMNVSSISAHGSGETVNLHEDRYAALKPGPQTYHYRYVIQLSDTREKNKVIGERTIEETLPWQLLADDAPAPLLAMKPDPSLQETVKKSLHVEYILRDDQDTSLAQIMIQVDHPPTNMAFDMSLRAEGETWPLGPVAWLKDKIGWWAFEIDLPESVRKADVVLIPSAQAAARRLKEDSYRLMGLDGIWAGEEIDIAEIPVRTQRIGMMHVRSQTKEKIREYGLEQLDSSDPVAQQLNQSGDVAGARAQLEQKLKVHANDAVTHYNLGCLLMADDDLPTAMGRFVEAGRHAPAESLKRKIQRQQRWLCGIWLETAEKKEDAAAMGALGATYEHGWGVAPNLQEAKRWYRNASNAGDATAMCRLAAMYEHETGATVHTEKSAQWYHDQTLEWYRKSASLGNEEAKQWLNAHDH